MFTGVTMNEVQFQLLRMTDLEIIDYYGNSKGKRLIRVMKEIGLPEEKRDEAWNWNTIKAEQYILVNLYKNNPMFKYFIDYTQEYYLCELKRCVEEFKNDKKIKTSSTTLLKQVKSLMRFLVSFQNPIIEDFNKGELTISRKFIGNLDDDVIIEVLQEGKKDTNLDEVSQRSIFKMALWHKEEVRNKLKFLSETRPDVLSVNLHQGLNNVFIKEKNNKDKLIEILKSLEENYQYVDDLREKLNLNSKIAKILNKLI